MLLQLTSFNLLILSHKCREIIYVSLLAACYAWQQSACIKLTPCSEQHELEKNSTVASVSFRASLVQTVDKSLLRKSIILLMKTCSCNHTWNLHHICPSSYVHYVIVILCIDLPCSSSKWKPFFNIFLIVNTP